MTADELRQVLDYESDTGLFRWRVSGGKRRRAGDIAGCVSGKRYRTIGIGGRTYLAHRLAWLHACGEWPKGEIDHINREKSDNRIVNLRDVGRVENRRNSGVYRNNKLGVANVSFRAKTGNYVVGFRPPTGRLHVGEFASLEEAIKARNDTAVRLYGEFAALI